jgi:SAM-dependent methyltransferase
VDDERSRHLGIDRAAFARRVREVTNVGIETAGHHPFRVYTPSAWRHYTRRLAVLDRLKSLDFQSALDVGCAEGFFMDAIAQSRDCEVWGVDLSDAGPRVARTRYGLPVAAAQATALPFADGAFDLVYSTEVIEHVLDPEAMLAEMQRVARRHVLVTTLVSQTDHAHAPDYEVSVEGHVNDFDLPAIQRLFGGSADIRTFRNNSTFALLTALGRHLPAGIRDAFYRLDLAVGKRWGAPHHRVKALRNRDWLIVAGASAKQSHPAQWRCPHCHGPLAETDRGLYCETEELLFAFAASGIPDFVSEKPDPAAPRSSEAR